VASAAVELCYYLIKGRYFNQKNFARFSDKLSQIKKFYIYIYKFYIFYRKHKGFNEIFYKIDSRRKFLFTPFFSEIFPKG